MANPKTLAVAGIFALSCLSLAYASPALAHATFETATAEAGKTSKNVLRVPHGCGTQATHTIRIQIPEGVHSVKPMPKPGWTLTTVTGNYPKPVMAGEKQILEGVREIIWSGGNLPNEHYDEFVFRSAISSDTNGDTMLFFPATQECATDKVAWIEIPAAGQDPHTLKMPAPGIRILQAQAISGHDSHMAKQVTINPSTTIKLGALSIEAPWTRATPAGAKVGGGYMKITNTGKEPDRLVGGALPQAGRFEVHEMAVAGGVMTMRQLAAGLVIRPGETVELKPGSMHLMFMDLKEPLKTGMPLKGTLLFEKAGQVEVEYHVAPIGAGSMGDHTHH
jgi:periplasmic copper chaperone A